MFRNVTSDQLIVKSLGSGGSLGLDILKVIGRDMSEIVC